MLTIQKAYKRKEISLLDVVYGKAEEEESYEPTHLLYVTFLSVSVLWWLFKLVDHPFYYITGREALLWHDEEGKLLIKEHGQEKERKKVLVELNKTWHSILRA